MAQQLKIDSSIASFITSCQWLLLRRVPNLNVLLLLDGFFAKPSGQKTRLFLSVPEIKRVVKAFADCGTSKIRITGGEPSLRKRLS